MAAREGKTVYPPLCMHAVFVSSAAVQFTLTVGCLVHRMLWCVNTLKRNCCEDVAYPKSNQDSMMSSLTVPDN